MKNLKSEETAKRGGRNRNRQQQPNQNRSQAATQQPPAPKKEEPAKEAPEKAAQKEDDDDPNLWVLKAQENGLFKASRQFWVEQVTASSEIDILSEENVKDLIAFLGESGEDPAAKADAELTGEYWETDLGKEQKELMLKAIREKYVSEVDLNEEIDFLDEISELLKGDKSVEAIAWTANWLLSKLAFDKLIEEEMVDVSDEYVYFAFPEK